MYGHITSHDFTERGVRLINEYKNIKRTENLNWTYFFDFIWESFEVSDFKFVILYRKYIFFNTLAVSIPHIR